MKIKNVEDVKELPDTYYCFHSSVGDGKAEAVKGAERQGANTDMVYRYVDGKQVTWAFEWK